MTGFQQRVGRLGRHDGVSAGGIFLACLALYALTMAPSVVPGDGGEMQMLAAVLGVAHPTGYPLFTLLGWLCTHLPLGGDAAYRVTFLAAMTAAGAAACLYLVVRELGIGRLAALLAALLAAVMPTMWLHATAADVHPLASLFLVLGLWLLLRWSKGKTPLWAAALVFGFGLAHHISIRLLGPAVLIYLLAVEPRLPLRPRRWLPALACLLLPFAVYAYIPLRVAHFESLSAWAGRIVDVRRVVAAGYVSPHYYGSGTLGMITGGGYVGQFFSSPDVASIWGAAREYFDLAQQQFPLVAIPVAVLGAWVAIRGNVKAGGLLLLSYLTVLGIAIRYLALIGEDGHSFIPTHLVVAIWFGVGAGFLLEKVTQRRRWLRVSLIAGLCAMPAYAGLTHLPLTLAQRQPPTIVRLLDQALPSGAVIAGDWPDVTMLRYYQRVEGRRPDLWIIHADLTGTRMLLGKALTQGIPFYALRSTAAGPRLWPVTGQTEAAISHPADLCLSPVVRWRGYDLGANALHAGAVLPLTLYWQTTSAVGQDWTTFIHLLDVGGEKVAQVDHVPLGDYYPPSQWQPGQLLADQYELPLPTALPPGRYRLIFGWYRDGDRLAWCDGQETQTLAEITIGPQAHAGATSRR